MKLNPSLPIEIVEALVGSKGGHVAFFETSHAHERNSIIKDSLARYMRDPNTIFHVQKPMVTLDHFCEQRALKPDVIKIDVEGMEIDILEGAKKLLSTYKPVLILSVHPFLIGKAGQSIVDLRRLIDEIGYHIHGKECLSDRANNEYVLYPVSSLRGLIPAL